MIRKVSFEGTTFASIPSKFEPGTPNIAGVIGWGAAIDWISKLPWPELAAYEEALGALALSVLRTSGATVYAVEGERVPTWSFNLPDIHPHDVGTILDQMGIAVRTGHHCCQPLMRHLAIPATVRASLSFTNLPEEIDRLAEGLSRATETLG
jgi:cysteine desulfurase/selenocysteine lyase